MQMDAQRELRLLIAKELPFFGTAKDAQQEQRVDDEGPAMKTAIIPKWTYPANSPFAGEPLNSKDIQLIKDILKNYPLLTPEKAIEIAWAFGGI